MKTAVVLACDDNFVAYASVVARRVEGLSSESFPIILLSDGVSDENKRLAQRFCSRISFVEVSKELADLPLATSQLHTRAAYARLKIDECVEADRVVYIDCDVSVLTDLSPLLHLPLKSAPVAAVLNDMGMNTDTSFRQRLKMSEGSPYFNSGVMVIDLAAARMEGILPAALSFAVTHPSLCRLPDQDSLNAVIDGRWQLLDWRWNVTHLEYQSKPAFVRHFIGPAKPWSNIKTRRIEPVFVDQWRSDMQESPWPERFLRVGTPGIGGFRSSTRWLRAMLFSRSNGRRGDRARALLRYESLQAAMEKAAAGYEIAPHFPELALSK